MRLGAANPIFLLCSLYLRSIDAIFADDAYQVDFHHVLLGAPQPRNTFLYRPSVSSKASLLYTLSDRSVLGAVNPKDGSVVWRQQLSDGNGDGNGNGLLQPSSRGNLVISAVNGTVQAWDAAEGRLVWDWIGHEEIKALVVSQIDVDGHDVYVITQNNGSKAHVRKLAQHSGALIWEYQDERYDQPAFGGVAQRMMLTCFSGDMPLGLSISTQGLFYVALHSTLLQGSKVKVTSLNASNGNAQSSTTLNADIDLSDTQSVLSIESTRSSSLLVWSDRTLKSFRINTLGTNQILTTRLSNEKETSIQKIQFHALARDGGAIDITVHCQSPTSHWLEVYRLDSNSENLEKSYQLPSVEGPAVFSVAIHSGDIYFVRTTKRDVTLFSSTSDNVLGQWLLQAKPYDHLAESYDIPYAVSEVVARGKSNYAVRSALLLSSGDWKMIHNGEELWLRPESLSGVVTATWVDTDSQQSLAEELAVESHSNIGKAYVHRIKRHMRNAQSLLPWIKSLPDRTIYSLLGRDQRLGPSSSGNSFGFHKLVVAATDSGRLFALDVGSSGKILWTIQASEVKPWEQWSVESIEVGDGVALVRVLGGGSLTVDVMQGVILEDQLQSTKPGIKTTIILPNSPRSALSVQINVDGTIAIPQHGHLSQNTVIVTQDEKMVVRGWSLGTSKPSLIWAFSPRLHEKIVGVAARSSNDPVASIGKALGDRNVLYKFLNPNLLVISSVNIETHTASFDVLDSISGQVVHTLTHPMVDVTKPITCVVSENWFAYTIFSNFSGGVGKTAADFQSRSKGYQLVVSELFESPLANDRGVLGSASNPSTLHPKEADTDDQNKSPHVISQTYLLPAALSFMTVSSTLQGITPRSLLCVVPSLNSLIAIPRAVVDPRRPVGRDATSAEAEEGLFRHDGALEYDSKWVLNHMREIQGIQKVITSPSLLESTSLVFAFGSLDMFGTRVAPIGGFDILGKGFNRIQLIGTVAALALGTGVLAPLVRKKQTDSRWKGA
ncbi:MAG: hypothetical protein Q9188_005573 [Gyalolechia gomerana]